MSTIFTKLGIYGMPEAQENALLASMLTGDPSLLIGKQGTAKTGLITAIGAAMNQSTVRKYPDDSSKHIKYHAYDSSKINFEDLIGIPNVNKFSEGVMEYVESPQTAWDKDIVCFDEFNRQLPERQNNLFEMIRSRTLMGSPTEIKWIFNCMNPFGMAGTEELDEALVDRHMWFLYINDFQALDDQSKVSVVSHVGHHDAPALKRYWLNETAEFDIEEGQVNNKLADVGDQIFDLMEHGAKFYKELEKEVGEAYSYFVSRFVSALAHDMNKKDWKVELTGRRAGMLKRGLIAYRAVQLAKSKIFGLEPQGARESAQTALLMSIPVGVSQASATGMDHNAITSIKSNVDSLGQFFESGSTASMIAALDTIFELRTTTSLARKIQILTEEVTDEHSANQAWSDIINPRDRPDENSPEHIQRSILVNIVAHLITKNPKAVPANFQKNMIQEASRSNGMSGLFKAFSLKGATALYAEEVEQHIDSFESPFVRLQASLTYSTEMQKNPSLSKQEFRHIKARVIAECEELKSIISSGKVNEIKENVEEDKETSNAAAIGKSFI